MTRFPSEGCPWPAIRSALEAAKRNDCKWQEGRLPAYIYFVDDDLHEVVTGAYLTYFTENAMGKKAFPSVAGMEAEIVDMGLDLFHAGEGAAGSFTSGGTESIFLAVKTARDYARATRPIVRTPNLVLPFSAHAAFNKAAHYLGLEARRCALTSDYRADVREMSSLIDDNTVLIVASAPSYPHGRFDDIEALARLARERGLPLHVDACFGGFVSPFAAASGREMPPFDFAVDGVTSLSADLHKYGYAAKGASLVLYRDRDYKMHQGFEFDGWARGIYSTETFTGSRPAGTVAAAWAVMKYLGRAGYESIVGRMLDSRDRLVAGLRGIDEIEVLEPVEHCIVLYRSRDPAVDTNAVAALLADGGWFVGRTDHPPAICMAINPMLEEAVVAYVSDLKNAVVHARQQSLTGSLDRRTY